MVHALCRESERITTGDVLSGLVLMGLLIDQTFTLRASSSLIHPLPLDTHHPDLSSQFFEQLLVASQFDRMGNFLFGLGVYRCFQQARQARLDANRIVQRLLIGLLAIGLSLSLLCWSANLLVWYAGLGFTLLYVINQSLASLLTWMVSLGGLAIGVPILLELFHPTGLTQHGQGFSRYLSYELMMLGGLLMGKLGIDHRDHRLRVRLSLVQLGLLPVAFLVKGGWVAFSLGLIALPRSVVTYQYMLMAVCGFLGPLLLTGVYLLDVGLNARLTPSGWASWLGRVGQLSLTNYVLQSILCPLLLYGAELAVPGPLPFWGRAVIVLGILAVQIGFSRLWGKHFWLGSLEWVFRQWLYGKSV